MTALFGSSSNNVRAVIVLVPTPSDDGDGEYPPDDREALLQPHEGTSWRLVADPATDADMHCTCKLYVFMRRTEFTVTTTNQHYTTNNGARKTLMVMLVFTACFL